MLNDVETLGSAASETEEVPLLSLHVQLPGGDVHKIEAAAGFNAMELMRAAGIPIKAECGGAGVCATCHVRVPDHWSDRLDTPDDDEHGKLDEIPSANDNSRLCCQIRMTDALDGLHLELQADSLSHHHLDAAE